MLIPNFKVPSPRDRSGLAIRGGQGHQEADVKTPLGKGLLPRYLPDKTGHRDELQEPVSHHGAGSAWERGSAGDVTRET